MNPEVLRLDPQTASVVPFGAVPMAVILDIPAGAAGNRIELSSVPGMSDSVPANVLVPEDKISVPFNFTANATEGIKTVSASLGTSTVQGYHGKRK